MSGVSPCLRRLFICFNVVFVVVGGLIMVTSLSGLSSSLDGLRGGQDELEVQTTGHIVLYVFGSVTMAISILGALGAYRENLVAVVVFLLCTVIGGLLMLRDGAGAASLRPQLDAVLETRWRLLLPLDQASDDVKHRVEALQTSLNCCGLFGHKDWGDNVPDSCLCSQPDAECQAIDYRNFLSNLLWQKKSVFRQSCFPLILPSVKTNLDVTLAVSFTLCVLALLGSLLASLIIYQMCNRPMTLQTALFHDQPPAYQQLYNLPE